MKKVLPILASTLVIASSTAAATMKWDFTPYVGADAQWRHMNFQKGLGGNLFKPDYPQGNVYAGIRLCDVIGIEGGYESTVRKTKATTLTMDEFSAGVDLDAITQFHSTSRIKGPHINLVGALPLWKEYGLSITGLVGIARLKLDAVRQTNYVYVGGIIPTDPTTVGVSRYSTFIKKKAVLRLGAGLEHKVCDNWGVRGTVVWEGTNKFNDIPSKEVANARLKLKNSLIYGLGAFITF